MRVPLNRAGALHRIGKRASAMVQELGREATHDEIAKDMSLPLDEVSLTMGIAQGHISLDSPVTPGEDNRLSDYLADTEHLSPEEEMHEKAMLETVVASLGRLKEREAKILRMYFGLDEAEPLTLEEIGLKLGITRERVRQIKAEGAEPSAPREQLPGPRELLHLLAVLGAAGWCAARAGAGAERLSSGTAARGCALPIQHRSGTCPMADTNSFDVTTSVDLQEVDNAVNQAKKEVAQRYDFKGVMAEIEFSRAESKIELKSNSDMHMESMFDVLQAKLIKRGVCRSRTSTSATSSRWVATRSCAPST